MVSDLPATVLTVVFAYGEILNIVQICSVVCVSFQTEDDQGDGLEPPEVRSIDELRMYDKFFPEVFEFEVRTC